MKFKNLTLKIENSIKWVDTNEHETTGQLAARNIQNLMNCIK
jgi:hypothetical protein